MSVFMCVRACVRANFTFESIHVCMHVACIHVALKRANRTHFGSVHAIFAQR
jgi:hypothetical protein